MVGALTSGLAAAADAVSLFLLDTVLKATVLLILAWVAAALLRRASAAVRHRVWCLVFVGLVLLPVVLLALPAWRLPVLPGLASSPGTSRENPGIEIPAITHGREDGARMDRTGNPADVVWGQDPPMASVAALATSDGDLAAVPNPEPRDVGWVSDPSRTAWKAILHIVWLIGLAWALLPIAVSPIYKRILVKRARPVVDREPSRLLAELCRSLNVRRRVRVLEINRSLVPMTWGLLRPIVLLPLAWREWPLERQRIVLLHELAHVKRLDPAFQLLARLACALYWFHPLAWYALRRLRIERESACDDCVLMAGERPSEYARQLVAIARDYRAAALPVAVAMAHTTRLERRVRAVLDRAASHLPISRGTARLTVIFAALVLATVSMVGPAGTATDGASTGNEPAAPVIASAATDASEKPAETGTPAAPVAANPGASAEPASRDAKADDSRMEYRGQVIDPDGKPVAGAKIFLCYWVPGAPPDYVPKPRAVTGKEGRFEFAVTRDDFEPSARDAWKGSAIVAAADGYGFAAGSSLAFETTGKAVQALSAEALAYFAGRLKNPKRVLQLLRDDLPVQARVTTADGKPVAGARIRVNEVWYTDGGNLTAFEKAAKDQKADYYSLRRQVSNLINGTHLAAVVPSVETDKDGQFTLRGVGRERIAQFLVRGPGIESKLLKARTRPGQTIAVPHVWRDANTSKRDESFHGARFDYIAGPSKPVVGRVTDAETGKPIPGVRVSAGQEGTFFRSGSPFISTLTDAEGRYRLEGIPIGKQNHLNAFPPQNTPYLPAGLWLNTRVAEPSVSHDFRLKQGIWVRGRAVDDRAGKPVPGRVQYFAFRNNPHLKSFPESLGGGVAQERRTDDEGRFEIAVIPGPGLITFTAADHTRYRRGRGADTITGPTVNMGGNLKIFDTLPTHCIADNERLLRQIDPKEGSEPPEMTLTLTSGVDVTGYVLDPEGKRLSGYNAHGNVQKAWYPVQSEELRVEGYYADRPRDLYFYHPARDLAAFYRLEGKPPKELAVTLHPAGSVRGRAVDDSGRPLAGVKLFGEGVPSENYGDTSLRLGTDPEGRFLIRGLIPGQNYTIAAARGGIYGYIAAKNVTVEAGKTKDLGDVRLQPESPTAPPSTPSPPKRRSKP